MKVPRDAFGLRPQAFPRDFHKPPRFAGDLITIFLKTMVLLINNSKKQRVFYFITGDLLR